MSKILKSLLLTAAAGAFGAAQAAPLSIVGPSPTNQYSTGTPDPTCWSMENQGADEDFVASNQVMNQKGDKVLFDFSINDAKNKTCNGGAVSLSYKIDAPSTESGAFSGWYQASAFNSDRSGVTISYTGGATGSYIACSVANPCWLVVKDGKSDPSRYGYKIDNTAATSLWNGLDDIVLSGFWTNPEQGEISHVGIYGGVKQTCTTDCDPDRTVPAPATLTLVGLALAGLGVAGRRRRA